MVITLPPRPPLKKKNPKKNKNKRAGCQNRPAGNGGALIVIYGMPLESRKDWNESEAGRRASEPMGTSVA